jgi:hypothetical protein
MSAAGKSYLRRAQIDERREHIDMLAGQIQLSPGANRRWF